MGSIGEATVKIRPEVDAAALKWSVKQAIVEALRDLADEIEGAED